MPYFLTVQLLSDATFGRGEGLAGLLNTEIEYDEYGCPLIGARSLKGLLVEEWANLRFALGDAGVSWDAAAALLFGASGANAGASPTGQGSARVHVGPATLPPDLRTALRADSAMTPERVLAGLTSIRRQTSIEATTGAPEQASLRAMRVLLRGTQLIARLDLDGDTSLPNDALGLLAACALGVRRGGTARNRGRGRIALLLHEHEPSDYLEDTFSQQCFRLFAQKVQP